MHCQAKLVLFQNYANSMWSKFNGTVFVTNYVIVQSLHIVATLPSVRYTVFSTKKSK